MRLFLLPLLITLALPLSSHATGLVVVTGAQSPVAHLSQEQVADIYLGRVTTLPGGASALPLDLPASRPERETFYNRIAGKSASQIKAYWAKMSFTGKGIPPKQLSTGADIKKLAAQKNGAIGYLEEDEVDASVKVVCTLK